MKRSVTMIVVALSASAWAQTPPGAAPNTQPPNTQPPSATAAAPQAPAMDESHRVAAAEIDKLLAEGKVLLLDVREPKELEELGAIEDSVNIPLPQLEKRLSELPKDRLILTA